MVIQSTSLSIVLNWEDVALPGTFVWCNSDSRNQLSKYINQEPIRIPSFHTGDQHGFRPFLDIPILDNLRWRRNAGPPKSTFDWVILELFVYFSFLSVQLQIAFWTDLWPRWKWPGLRLQPYLFRSKKLQIESTCSQCPGFRSSLTCLALLHLIQL